MDVMRKRDRPGRGRPGRGEPGLPMTSAGDVGMVGWVIETMADGALVLRVQGTPYGLRVAPDGWIRNPSGGNPSMDGIGFMGAPTAGPEPENGSPG